MKLPLPILLIALALPAHGEVTIELSVDDRAVEENLRSHLRLPEIDCDTPDWRVRRLFARVERDLGPALRALGYYRSQITTQLDFENDCWAAEIAVDPGERTVVRKRTVRVLGAATDDPRLPALLADLPLAEGAPLNHARYEDIKASLRAFAAERGYLDFNFIRQQLRVYPEQAAAEIDIEADSGPRYRFGELRLDPRQIDRALLRQLADVREGEPYSVRKLTALNRTLSDTGYFTRVDVRPLRDQAADLAVPVEVTLEPARRHAWRAGIGYATDTGPRVSLGYDNRYVNPSGHTFTSDLQLSPIESSLTADYRVPGRDPRIETFSFGARLLHEDTDSAKSDSASLIVQQLLKSDDWNQTRFIELLHERSVVAGRETTATLLMPGLGFDRTRADDVLRTYRGYRVHFEVRGAYEGLLSTATLLQFRAGAKGIRRLGKKGGRLTARLDAGTTLGENIDELPASLQFFAGGDNSVRGYKYESLGPLDASGQVEGGRHLLTGSLEYEHPVFADHDDWWVGAFVDAGNAFDTDRINLKVGYGVGVRWYSPIGRLRFDLAFPEDTSRDSWRIHFGLGADL